jgi:hypothetical protein
MADTTSKGTAQNGTAQKQQSGPKPSTGDGTPMKPAPLDPLSPQVRLSVEQAMLAGADACKAAAANNPQEFKEFAQGVAALGQALSAKIGFGG